MAKATTSKKAPEATTITPAPTEITLSFIKLDKRTFTLTDANLIVNLTHVKDVTYFKRGMIYFNLRAIKNTLIDVMTKIKEDMAEATKTEQDALAIKLSAADDRFGDINARINALDLPEDVETAYNNDMFLQFCAHTIGWNFNIPENTLNPIMDILRTTQNNAGLDQVTKNNLKAALNKVCEIFGTEDNVVYKKSVMNFNATMTELVYRTYADKPKLGKKGAFKESWKNARIMSNIILTIACAKYQGKIYQQD